MKQVLVSWSSGKDSSWMLHRLRQREDVAVVALLTTFNELADRAAMHAARRTLVEQQAASIGLPLWPVMLPSPCSNAEYATRMAALIERAQAAGVTHCAFGDLFLEDIRDYRVRQLSGTGVQPLFPIWCGQRETPRLARDIIAGGFRALLTCVDPRQAPASLAGRPFDEQLLADLPPSVDPCGERGEFHTFCYDGPIFRSPVSVEVGQVLERDGFVFADLTPAEK
jgi:uncharacterized protein (TIGR00290 family)